MSARSGVAVSDELVQVFTSALSSQDVRFVKASIRNESIVSDGTTKISGDFDTDLGLLQAILHDEEPSYVLTKLDDGPTAWLAISYVPDTAKVRDKMLYAASRASLTKSLGSGYFTDSLFATSKSDLTPDAYQAHRKHNAAPNPLSSREQELEDLKNAEAASGSTSYEGSRARKNHIGTAVGFPWDEATEAAVDALNNLETSHLIITTIGPPAETLTLISAQDTEPDSLAADLPSTEPSYAFYLWCHLEGGVLKRDLVFLYTCPTTSNVRSKMLYSSGAAAVMHTAKERLGETIGIAKRIETSDPKDLTEALLREELGTTQSNSDQAAQEKKAFAKPKGPARKR